MSSTAWSADELERIGQADELTIAARRHDGALLRPVPIWVVRVADELYVRSWRGAAGSWFRAARTTHTARIAAGGIERDVMLVEGERDSDERVDAAYRAKYGRSPSYVEAMVAPHARATTLKLLPRDR